MYRWLGDGYLHKHTQDGRRKDDESARLRYDVQEVLRKVPDDLRQLAEMLKKMSVVAAARDWLPVNPAPVLVGRWLTGMMNVLRRHRIMIYTCRA